MRLAPLCVVFSSQWHYGRLYAPRPRRLCLSPSIKSRRTLALPLASAVSEALTCLVTCRHGLRLQCQSCTPAAVQHAFDRWWYGSVQIGFSAFGEVALLDTLCVPACSGNQKRGGGGACLWTRPGAPARESVGLPGASF